MAVALAEATDAAVPVANAAVLVAYGYVAVGNVVA